MLQEFDQFAKNYRDIIDPAMKATGETSDYFAHLKAQKLTEWFPHYIDKNISILDFGCGVGAMTSHIIKYFGQATVYGIDPSQESIRVAQEKLYNVNFRVASGINVGFSEKMFDLVVAANVFHHIPFQEHILCAQEIFRVLKPGGNFIMMELNPYNPGTRYIFNRNPIDRNAQLLVPRYSARLFHEYGKIQIKYFCFFPALLRKLRFLEAYATKVPLGGLYALLTTKLR